MKKRDAKIAKRIRRGETVKAVAERYEITPRHVDRIASAIGGARARGRKPTGAVTHNTARGRAALATLVADAAAAGIEVEAYLDLARTNTAPPRGES